MESKNVASELHFPNEHLDFCLQPTSDPELFFMKGRNEDENQIPLKNLIELIRIVPYLKFKFEKQNLGSIKDVASSTLKVPEVSIREDCVVITTPQEFWIESSENSNLMIENKCSISPKRLWERPHVIHKSILRSFKKYYLNELDDLTDFKKKFKIANCQDDLLNLANEFISQKIIDNPYKDLNLFIVALTRPNLEETLVVDPKLAELSSLVKNVFYGFNKSKMSDLLSYPQFSFMLKKFLSISQLTEFIMQKYSCPFTTENLASQVSFLIERWDEVLATHDPESVCDQTSSPQIGL